MIRTTTGGYVRFYRSLTRFCRDMNDGEAAELTHELYTANVLSQRLKYPGAVVTELNKDAFYSRLTGLERKPYRTIIQLYRSMEVFPVNIDIKNITVTQSYAFLNLLSLMEDLEYRFKKAF